MVTEASLAVCCSICGAPHNRSNEVPATGCEWWETILIHEPGMPDPPEEESYCKLPIEEIQVQCLGGPSSLVATDGTYYRVSGSEEWCPYIPVHPKCLDIAKKVLTYREQTFPADKKGFDENRVGPASMNQLYDVFSFRSFCGMVGPQGTITEPHQYYGMPDIYERGEWDWELVRKSNLQKFTACPFPIRNITQIILSFLRPLSGKVWSNLPQESSIQESLGLLPTEVIDLICQHLHPFENPSLRCSGELQASLWRDLLFNQGLLPWLWDLDHSLLQRRRSESLPAYDIDNVWDWERLVRQLAQTEAFEPGSLMENAPLGLRNRRRIWRLVYEARKFDSKDKLPIYLRGTSR